MTRSELAMAALVGSVVFLSHDGRLLEAQVAGVVSLAVSKETAPPGGMAQVKVFITEPKPISTGRGSYSFAAYESVDGIALMNELEDVAGLALVRGSNVILSFTSPSATFGMDPDYPVLTVAGRIPVDAPLGRKYPLVFDATTLQLLDPSGQLYAVEAKAGHLITAPGVSIDDVNPGSAIVPPGGVVTITGTGFVPGTEIKFKEAKLSRVRYVSAQQIDVVVANTTSMHGMMIRASNPDGTRSTYFSYQRTGPMVVNGAPVLSADAVLRYAVPLVPPHGAMQSMVSFPAPDASSTYGIAVQNLETTGALVSPELIDATGEIIAVAPLTIPPSRFVVLALTELFASVPPTARTVRISSDIPVQVLGVVAHQDTGTATPILPH